MTLRWGFISDNRADFGVQRICRVLQVSRSGFYRWIAGAKAREVRQAADDALAAEIREIHTDHKGTYGVRRVHAELRGFGLHEIRGSSMSRLGRDRRHRPEDLAGALSPGAGLLRPVSPVNPVR
ncbi:IS3 family transposase [Actinacidiphila glaucinigra]|uniref:IS3 family transposase n=1 Tax=Actinacidiphila glaucinigra TaxID=235986 RepID=UPI003AF3AA56